LLISAIALAEKESGKVLEKDEELVFVQKELKQTKEELESIPDSRPELKEKAQQKIAIIESYLPKQMSDDEIREALEKIIAEKGLDHTKKSQGQVMKAMMAEYKGKTDGKTVSKVLGTLLH
jgi:uncharacterized protein YqeY